MDVSNATIGIVEVENRIGSPRLLAVAIIADGSNVERAAVWACTYFSAKSSALCEPWRS